LLGVRPRLPGVREAFGVLPGVRIKHANCRAILPGLLLTA
jgi:hypothetical protein